MDRGGDSRRVSLPFSQENRNQNEATNEQKIKRVLFCSLNIFREKKNAGGIVDILVLYESVFQRVALAAKDLRRRSNIKGGNREGVRKWSSRFFWRSGKLGGFYWAISS